MPNLRSESSSSNPGTNIDIYNEQSSDIDLDQHITDAFLDINLPPHPQKRPNDQQYIQIGFPVHENHNNHNDYEDLNNASSHPPRFPQSPRHTTKYVVNNQLKSSSYYNQSKSPQKYYGSHVQEQSNSSKKTQSSPTTTKLSRTSIQYRFNGSNINNNFYPDDMLKEQQTTRKIIALCVFGFVLGLLFLVLASLYQSPQHNNRHYYGVDQTNEAIATRADELGAETYDDITTTTTTTTGSANVVDTNINNDIGSQETNRAILSNNIQHQHQNENPGDVHNGNDDDQGVITIHNDLETIYDVGRDDNNINNDNDNNVNNIDQKDTIKMDILPQPLDGDDDIVAVGRLEVQSVNDDGDVDGIHDDNHRDIESYKPNIDSQDPNKALEKNKNRPGIDSELKNKKLESDKINKEITPDKTNIIVNHVTIRDRIGNVVELGREYTQENNFNGPDNDNDNKHNIKLFGLKKNIENDSKINGLSNNQKNTTPSLLNKYNQRQRLQDPQHQQHNHRIGNIDGPIHNVDRIAIL